MASPRVLPGGEKGQTQQARLLFSGPWVRRVVHLRQMLEIQMRIDLRGGDVGVAEQFLHGAQVAGGFQHVAGEGMAQQVRMHVLGEAVRKREFSQPRLYGARADGRIAAAAEQDGVEVARYVERALARYRQLVGQLTGEGCATGLVTAGEPTQPAVVQDWLDEFEPVQWILRLSPRLRRLHGD